LGGKEEKMKAVEFQAHIEAFQAYNEARGLSPRTTLCYKKLLRCFHRWFTDEYGNDGDMTARRIREFLAAKRTEGRKLSTIQTYWATLHAFFAFLVLDEVLPENEDPMKLVKPLRVPMPKIEPLTDKELRNLLDSFDKHNLADYRNYIICLLMLDTGLRVGEVVKLRLQDLNLENRSISITGKGHKQRTVYFAATMCEMLTDYIENVRHWLATGRASLFPPTRSKRDYIATEHMSTIMKKKMDEVGIARNNSSCHRLRHTFAVNYLRNGGDVFTLQSMLGHSDLAMTRRYVMLADEDVREAHAKASPVDRFDLPAPVPFRRAK